MTCLNVSTSDDGLVRQSNSMKQMEKGLQRNNKHNDLPLGHLLDENDLHLGFH